MKYSSWIQKISLQSSSHKFSARKNVWSSWLNLWSNTEKNFVFCRKWSWNQDKTAFYEAVGIWENCNFNRVSRENSWKRSWKDGSSRDLDPDLKKTVRKVMLFRGSRGAEKVCLKRWSCFVYMRYLNRPSNPCHTGILVKYWTVELTILWRLPKRMYMDFKSQM